MTNPAPQAKTLLQWVRSARERTLDLISDLDDSQLLGPSLGTVNPLLWEIGHVAWFQEKWVLRHAAGMPSLRADADSLYDSSAVPHDIRWSLPLPSRAATLAYMTAIEERICERLERREPSEWDRYFLMLAVFHEDMHTEAFAYTRQTLEYPPPRIGAPEGAHACDSGGGPCRGDVQVAGATFWLGAPFGEPFVFDNEKWAHRVVFEPFSIARAPVTQQEFVAFVEDGGYARADLWTVEGWRWREAAGASNPVYWRREEPGSWCRRDFNRWVPLEPDRPVLHVCWHEAEAFCRWANRRLPSEGEWELAAVGRVKSETSGCDWGKRLFPWGDGEASCHLANLDGRALGCADVGAYPGGDSPSGCRQMVGNVWEWTSTPFLPYPGFVRDPYKDYSEPWFGTHKVLRGGCWVTRSRLLRATYRNFYTPDRRDVWAGFRTCALDP
jgi:gamma-glutamyl hercynylcysteine S-oxide synthase